MYTNNGPSLNLTGLNRRGRLKTAALLVGLLAALSHLVPFALAQEPGVRPATIRGEIVLPRAGHDWMSQQIEEPCILPNPKMPGRLIMFYSAVSASNRVVAAVGKAWAEARDPFHWHPDEANPIFRPAQRGWDSSSIRLDTVLYIPEEDAYYIYYSGTTGTVQDRIGLAPHKDLRDAAFSLRTIRVRRAADENAFRLWKSVERLPRRLGQCTCRIICEKCS